MQTPQGFSHVSISFARELAERHQCFLLGVLMKPERRTEFANRGFFNLDPDRSLPSAKGDLIIEEDTEQNPERVRLLVTPLDLNKISTLEEEIQQLHGVLIKTSDFQTIEDKLKLKSILELLEKAHEVCQIDHQNDIQKVMNRSRFLNLLQSNKSSTQKVCSFPRSFDLACQCDEEEFMETMRRHEVEFPVIVKTLAACGVSRSHFMALVTNVSGVCKIEVDFPLQIQQFHAHGDSLWKVYLIGNKVFIQEESSLKLHYTSIESDVVHFDALEEKKSSLRTCSTGRLDPEIVRRTAIALRSASRLSLFGFDVIVDDRNRHFVIDVNYFPSMKRIENSIGAIHEMCYNRIRSHQKTQKTNSI